jgi:CDP-glucose 4,6-dehydratase
MEDLVMDARRWSGRRVLVTGCTGLVGAWLAKALCDAGVHVIGTARRAPRPWTAYTDFELSGRVQLERVGLEDDEAMRSLIDEYRPEVVFHLAAASQVGEAHASPVDAVKANVGGTALVLDSIRRAVPAAPVVMASTAAVYGTTTSGDIDEDWPLAPASPYAGSKAAAEMVARSYAAAYGLKVVALRCTNIYGAGDPNPERLIPSVMTALRSGCAPRLRNNGAAPRDFLYVEDAVRGFLRAAAGLDEGNGLSPALNLGSRHRVAPIEVARRLATLAGQPELGAVAGQGVEMPIASIAIERAKRLLGWEPRWTLNDGLHKTVAGYMTAAQAVRGETSRQ